MKNKFFQKRFLKCFILLLLPMSITAQNNFLPATVDCGDAHPPFDFDIKQAWTTSTGGIISTDITVLAGDIDGDGVVEIFAMDHVNINTLYIFDGRDGNLITTLPVSGGQHSAGGRSTSIVLCKINGKGAIFNHGRDGYLMLWTVSSAPGVRPITFKQEWRVSGGVAASPVNNSSADVATMPIAVDFDGDGIVEFVSKGQIIDSQNGAVLATMPYRSYSHPHVCSYHTAMDLDGDGLPEVTAGTEVYKYSRATGLQLWRSLSTISSGAITKRDGISVAADINQDGIVDLVFIDNGTIGAINMYVWTPATNTLIGTISVGNTGYRSYPFIGDIDGVVVSGKKYPEICINTTNRLYAYSYNGTSFIQKWVMDHSDSSGSTSLTLFDFNSDGVVELIYRDETHVRILDGSGSSPVEKYSRPCSSITSDETPIVVDATGDGSANIIVVGSGEVMAFEGGSSKWASCPSVWNQQMYSNLHVNNDLSIPTRIEQVNKTYTRSGGEDVQLFNGGPMQAPYVNEETFFPINLSSDVYIVSGSIEVLSSTAVSITITVGNQGHAVAPANTPIRYYRNSITPGNILSSANTTLGVDLLPGQTTTITQTISGLSPTPTMFYVRLLDDGVNFPAAGAFSDCNLTNNTKSLGGLELLVTATPMSICKDATATFLLQMINNSEQLGNPTTYNNIVITDILGAEWQYISATPTPGGGSTYTLAINQITWTIPTLAPQDTARLIVVAKALYSGTTHNKAWVETIDGTVIGKEEVETYVIVSTAQAPAAPVITPASPQICSGGSGSVTLTAVDAIDAVSYQWYKDNMEIEGAISNTYEASATGNYAVVYFTSSCISQRSNTVTVITVPPVTPVLAISADPSSFVCSNTEVTFTATPINGGSSPSYQWKKGGVDISGATSATYKYTPANGDVITCVMTSNAACATPPTVTSGNSLTMTVYAAFNAGTITTDNPFVCSGDVSAIQIGSTSDASGGYGTITYEWYKNGTAITGSNNATYNIPTEDRVNTGSSNVVIEYTRKAKDATCQTTFIASANTYTLTVYPTPTVTKPTDQTKPNGESTDAVVFTGNIASGVTYSWTNDNPAIGLAASGTGDIASFTATNITYAPISATITVTPTANGCSGASVTFTITVGAAIKPITVTANSGSSSYGDSPANPGFTATGLLPGDDESVLTGLKNNFDISFATEVGNYTLEVIGTLSNAKYTVTDFYTGQWTVNPANVTVTANSGSSNFGESPTNPGISISGFPSSIDDNILAGLYNDFNITSDTPAGSYEFFVQGDFEDSNFNLSRNSGVWVVNQLQGYFEPLSVFRVVYSPTLTLADVILPEGYKWNSPATSLKPGNNQIFAATYTDPSGNYTTVSGTLQVNVRKADGAEVSGPPTLSGLATESSIAVNTLTIPDNPGNQIVEYAISTNGALLDAPTPASLNGLSWQFGTTFTGSFSESTNYYVYARSASNTYYSSGPAQVNTTTKVGDFTGIVETGRAPSLLNAWIHDGTLYVSGLTPGKPWRIYNILGTLIYQGIATDVVETGRAPSLRIGRGIYIIMSEGEAVKIRN